MINYVVVLGSNLPSEFGNSFETLKQCIFEIRKHLAVESLLESNWYSSSSFLDKREPKYLNVGIRFSTNINPSELIEFTSGLENKYGRKRSRRWTSRTCDIDILLCDQQILPNREYFKKWLKLDFSDQIRLVPEKLVIPHPRLQERTFFLKPLHDLQPKWVHPFLKLNAKEMLDSLQLNEIESICELNL